MNMPTKAVKNQTSFSGYLTVPGIDAALQHIITKYPTINQIINLPERSHEGRTIQAVKIASGSGDDQRDGVLLLGGVHAREIVNSDLLISFALDLSEAYESKTGFKFGKASWDSKSIQQIVNRLDLFIFPLVNPDGREHVMSPGGEPMWRKNMNPNPDLPCKGVDINRNYDFLWNSGIGTSADSCSEIFKGAGAFSEPETRNVRYLLDHYTNIKYMIDIHSYSEDILYPWGDDDNQTSDPSMNFMNPKYDGLRGFPEDIDQPHDPNDPDGANDPDEPKENLYLEYIDSKDLDWFVKTGKKISDGILSVRGTNYTVKQSIGLYPTTATSDDYAYSRHIVDGSKARVYAYTLETGKEFQPPYSEALNIIAETSAGLIQFCLECLCTVTELARGTSLMEQLEAMRSFRDQELLTTPAGRRYVQLLTENTAELLELMLRDKKLREQAVDLVQRVNKVVQLHGKPTSKVIDTNLIKAAEKLIDNAARRASPALKKALSVVEHDLKFFSGKTVSEGLRAAGSEHSEEEQEGQLSSKA